MRHWLKTSPLLLILLLVVAGPAQAAILPGAAVDGPSNLIDTARPDVDVAPDNSAALVYLKSDGGVNHPFVSRFVNGAWGAPQRVDGDSAQAASNPRIAVANGGKVVVAYSRGGAAVARISAAPGGAFGLEHVVHAAGTGVDVDLSPNGNGYVGVQNGADIFADRLVGTTWSDVGTGALDSDQGHEAGGSNRDVKVAASPDGAGGAIAWGEVLDGIGTEQDVFVRRLTGSTPGNALGTRLAPGSLPGSSPTSGKAADQPAVSMDAAGTIWVVYRQDFEYGASKRNRAIARPITGETVGAGQVVDKMGDAPTEGRDFQQIDVNAAGAGLLSHHGNLTSGLEWASLSGGTWTANGLVNDGDNASVPQAVPALGENGSGLIAYSFKSGTGDNTASARTTFGGLGAQTVLSNPTFGPVISAVDAAAGSGAFAAAAFVQQSGNDATTKRVVAAVVDLPQPPGGGGGPEPDTTAPDVRRFRITRKVFRAGGLGTVIRWSQSEAGTDTIGFERRVKGRWRKVRRKMRFQATAGDHRLRFRGRIDRKHPLRPGRYRMTLTARDAAGNVSTPDRTRFKLLAKKRR
ncbi:MAG TPA: hypothetical protein VJT68_04060 [Thermoleophilaceae bacterium]|nr:hypothetical protein [Thermoleophilaceae bacterium]